MSESEFNTAGLEIYRELGSDFIQTSSLVLLSALSRESIPGLRTLVDVHHMLRYIF